MAERTDFEKEFEKLPQGTLLEVSRVLEWDPNVLCSIRRPQYLKRQFEPGPRKPLSVTWVANEFPKSVVGASDTESLKPIEVPRPVSEDSLEIDMPKFTDILHSARYDILARHSHEISKTEDTVQDIIRVLSIRELGERNQANLSAETIRSIVTHCHDKEEPIRFVIPAFPFKDQNPTRTESPPSHLDLNEILMLYKLYLVAFCVGEVYRYGAEWIITCDGLVYSDIFDVDPNEVLKYREKVRWYRNLLNLQNIVHIIDLSDLVKHIEDFRKTQTTIKDYLSHAINSDARVAERFRVLARGIASNLNLRKIAPDVPLGTLARALSRNLADSELSNSELQLRQTIDQAATQASIKYAAFTLALKYYNLYGEMFPNALRATIHPKPGQVGIRKSGSVYPWNGVPLVSALNEQVFWSTTKAMTFSKILQKAERHHLRRVFIKGEHYPFCYQILETPQ